jgi:hypothetical protein
MQAYQRTNFIAYFGWAIAGAVILISTVAFPFWNLIPEYVTETVDLVYVHEGGRCVVLTEDNFMFSVNGCEGKVGQEITVTYDVKIKDRISAFLP